MFGLALALTATFAVTPANAQVYPWCAEYSMRGGATNCGFSTLQQCEWAISGTGGFAATRQETIIAQGESKEPAPLTYCSGEPL
jgi:hypothetical protein